MLEKTVNSYLCVAYYLSGFCLMTILIWAGRAYLWEEKWQRQIRDAIVYFSTIGVLTMLLAIHPENSDAIFWRSLTWFCFTMLMVIELLWVSFLLEQVFRAIRVFVESFFVRAAPPSSRLRAERPHSYPRY